MDNHHKNHCFLLFLLILLLASSNCHSWSWFSSSSSSSEETHNDEYSASMVSEFSIEAFNDQRGIGRVENAKNNMVSLSSCWQNAYQHLFAGCSESLAVHEKRSRFAWHLSDCFQKDSGRPSFPFCDPKTAMAKCLKSLNEYEHKVYLEFYLETNTICHQLQIHAFKQETERLVNELKISANYAEEKLETIEERTEHLLQGSNQIHDSLNSIDIRTQQVAQTARNVGDHIDVVLKHSEAVYVQSRKIASTQAELQEGQVELKNNLKEGMAMLQDSYSHLGQEIDNLKNEAIEIEEEISRVGNAMTLKMEHLQSKADDIGNMAG
ncbi:protein GAMETE EXPRESSED 1-like, partial [Morus notabilis]|uniref:protein GAMETE EXPRESSED 1-like n=1 Tax=Morus notabilis TaxID=981085 RepID=UPI000CECE555